MPTTYKGLCGRYDKNVVRAYHTLFEKEENKAGKKRLFIKKKEGKK